MHFLKPNRQAFGMGIFGIASMALFAAIGAAIYSLSFLHGAAHADGQIVQFIERHDEDSGTIFYPVFSFHDKNGVEHVVKSSEGSAPPPYKVRDQIRVLYQPNDPTNAKIDSFFSVWGITVIIGGLGLFWLPIGVAILQWHYIVSRFKKLNPPVYDSRNLNTL